MEYSGRNSQRMPNHSFVTKPSGAHFAIYDCYGKTYAQLLTVSIYLLVRTFHILL